MYASQVDLSHKVVGKFTVVTDKTQNRTNCIIEPLVIWLMAKNEVKNRTGPDHLMPTPDIDNYNIISLLRRNERARG